MYSIIVDAQIKMKWSIVPTVTTGILSRGMHEPSLGSARRLGLAREPSGS